MLIGDVKNFLDGNGAAGIHAEGVSVLDDLGRGKFALALVHIEDNDTQESFVGRRFRVCKGQPERRHCHDHRIFAPRTRARASYPILLADSRLHLDPGAGRRFGLERTGEQMLGAAHRHTDAKKMARRRLRPPTHTGRTR